MKSGVISHCNNFVWNIFPDKRPVHLLLTVVKRGLIKGLILKKQFFLQSTKAFKFTKIFADKIGLVDEYTTMSSTVLCISQRHTSGQLRMCASFSLSYYVKWLYFPNAFFGRKWMTSSLIVGLKIAKASLLIHDFVALISIGYVFSLYHIVAVHKHCFHISFYCLVKRFCLFIFFCFYAIWAICKNLINCF